LYFCCRCLHYFNSNKKLEIHAVDCGAMKDCAIRLPSEDNKWLCFNNYSRKKWVSFVVYADLECTLEKTKTEETSNHKYQYHRIFSIAYYVHCTYDDSLSFYRFRRDKNCVAWFVEKLRGLAHNIKTIISANVPIADFTRDNFKKFNTATHCHMCEKLFAPDDTWVRDHCQCCIDRSIQRSRFKSQLKL